MREGQIRIDVRLFAGLREYAGTGTLALALEPGTTAGEARAAVWASLGLADPMPGASVVLAVNREYVAAGTPLTDGDELALVPPVSGGAPTPAEQAAGADAAGVAVHAAVSPEPIDQAALHARVARREAGAIVVFSGLPRDVPQLDYEAHELMARERIALILQEVAAARGVCAIAAEHRVGPVPWPEAAVVVAVSAPHRAEAFAAAREALDRIKAEAPIWKQEVDGDARAWVTGTVPPVAATAQPEPVPTGHDAPAATEPGERHPGGLLPHLREDGGATMVDVGGKASTERRALAAAVVSMTPATAELIRRGDLPKGDVLGVARIAGIMAAKRVPELVPLAHPLPLTKVDVRAAVDVAAGQVRIEAEARTVGKTGVEIEAMTAALVAAINIYDMVKGVERGIAVGPVVLIAKSGGRTDFAGPAPWEPGFRADDARVAPAAAAAAPAARAHEPGTPLDPPVRAGLLVISSSRAERPEEDAGSAALRGLADALGAETVAVDRVVDNAPIIAAAISRLADEAGCDLILTAGGTGCTVDDVTPEATLSVCDRPVPGIAEALRAASRDHTAAWPLSRGVAAIRGRTLVVNLPGSPKAAAEALPVLAPVLTHTVRLLRR